MAVILTDTRTIVDEGDAVGAWSGAATLYTTAPDPVEATGSLGYVVSNGVIPTLLAITSVDLTGQPIYAWSLPQGIMDTLVNGGNRIAVSDGTNTIEYHVGGSDLSGFRYDNINIGWQCFVLDPDLPPTNFTVVAGTEAALSWAAITSIGFTWKTLVKSVGGSENCWLDIYRHGGGGLLVTGGGVATEGNFEEISVADSSNANQQAFGIAHTVASGVTGLQGGLTFGDNVGTGSVDFLSTNETGVFEDRGFNTDKYFVKVVGNATGTTAFQLGTKVGTDGGSNGSSIICPAGVGALFDASDITVEDVLIYGSTISGFNTSVTFSSDVTNAPGHEIYATTFSGCGQIDPGLTTFKNNVIAGTTDATGGYLGNLHIDKLTFTSGGTGHAIYITATGTYNYTSNTFGGYGATASTDAVVYNNSGGLVTINANSGDTPTYRNGAGATTTIVAGAVTELVNVKDTSDPALNILNARVFVETAATITSGEMYKAAVTSLTQSAGVATCTTTAVHGLTTGDKIVVRGAQPDNYNKVATVTVTTTTAFTYLVDSGTSTPATGTPVVSFVVIHGLTDASGNISAARTWGANQPLKGWARKINAVSPFYKQGNIAYTLDNTVGNTTNVVLQSDE